MCDCTQKIIPGRITVGQFYGNPTFVTMKLQVDSLTTNFYRLKTEKQPTVRFITQY